MADCANQRRAANGIEQRSAAIARQILAPLASASVPPLRYQELNCSQPVANYLSTFVLTAATERTRRPVAILMPPTGAATPPERRRCGPRRLSNDATHQSYYELMAIAIGLTNRPLAVIASPAARQLRRITARRHSSY